MRYFKHSDLAKQFSVSVRTVHNWIEAAKSAKLNLSLHEAGNKLYIANTAKNISVITQLIASRKKYRNTKAVKVVAPSPEFYTIYSQEQIHDIATNLEIHHEIPRQYNYMNGGADHWNAYAESLAKGEDSNVINSTIKLLDTNQQYLDDLLSQYKKVNVVDIGVGNAQPTRGLLERLILQGKMGRYIALDISPSILQIAQRNIAEWFGEQIKFEGHECDINYDRFSDLLMHEYVKKDAKETVNLVLLLGGTLANMRTPDGAYKIIHDSMGINDLLVYSKKLDTQATRQYFDFSLNPGVARLPDIHRLLVDLLNIDESYYDIELGYDPELKQRFEQIRLKVSIILKLKFNDGERMIELSKGTSILTWRAHQQSPADVHAQFTRNDFYVLHSSQTDDQDYILTVSRVQRG